MLLLRKNSFEFILICEDRKDLTRLDFTAAKEDWKRFTDDDFDGQPIPLVSNWLKDYQKMIGKA